MKARPSDKGMFTHGSAHEHGCMRYGASAQAAHRPQRIASVGHRVGTGALLLITMAECCPAVVPFHLGSMHAHGSMPSLNRTLCENSENQDFIVRSFPDAVANFCEKSTSTDCCELEHSSIVVRCVGAHVLHACTHAACLHGCIGWVGSLHAISTSAGCSPST